MFQGFPQSGFKFLKELRLNNNREWFTKHKSEYEKHIKFPAIEIIEEMHDIFTKNNIPFLAHPKKSLFRIYRDTRFSNDKTPYKTHVGITFTFHSDEIDNSIATKTEKPGMYIHLEPNNCFIAGGLYAPDSTQLRNIRVALDTDWKLLEQLSKQKKLLQEFPAGLTGEQLKTMPRGFSVEHPGKELLRMKQFLLFENVPQKMVQSPSIISVIENKAKAMAPIMEFLSLAMID